MNNIVNRLFFSFCLVITGEVAQAQDLPLEPNKSVERQIASGESHSYALNLNAGQFTRVVVEQKGVEAAVALVAPDGTQVLETNLTAIGGLESLSYEASVGGGYRIVVRSAAPNAPKGTYQVRLEVKAAPSAVDKQRIAAERVLTEAFKSNQQGATTVDLSIEKAKQALALWREISDRYWEALTLNLIGNASSSGRKYDQAIDYFNQALAIRREVKDRFGEGNTLGNLGNAYRLLNRHDKAIEHYGQALSIRRELKDRAGEGTVLFNLGSSYASLTQNEKAIEYSEQALFIFRELKNRAGEASTLNALGVAYRELNRNEKAIECFEQGLAIYRELKNRAGEGGILNALGLAYRALNRNEKAIEYYEQALPISRELKNRANEGLTLNNLGQVHIVLGRNEKAIEFSEQALAIFRELKNRSAEGSTLSALGSAYRALNRNDKAIEYYEKALVIHREIKNRVSEGNTLNNLGNVFGSLKNNQKAIEYYEEALVIHREVKNRVSEANTLNNLGDAHRLLNQNEKAIEYLEQALQIRRELKNQTAEGGTLFNLGLAYSSLNRNEKSIEYYEQSLVISREIKNRANEGLTLRNLGNAYYQLSQHEKSVECQERALVIYRELKDRAGEVGPIIGLGNAFSGLSQFEKAIKFYEEALAISRETKHRVNEGGALLNLAIVYEKLGRYEIAVEYFDKTVATFREIKDRLGEGMGLHDLGITYYKLGRYDKAIELLEQGLAIYRELKNQRGEGAVLSHLGTVNRLLGRYERSTELYEQSLVIFRELKNRRGEGETLNGQGINSFKLNRPEKAIAYYEQALVIFREVKERDNEASSLDNLGEVYRSLKRIDQAIATHEQALRIAREIKTQNEEASSLNNLMLDWKARNKPNVAVFFGKQSVNLYQEIRSNIRSLDQESQQSYLRSKEDTYRKLADLLIAQGRLPEAEQVINMLKEEEYFDFIRRDGQSAPQAGKATLTSDEDALDKRYREIADKLAALGTERGALIDKKVRTADEDVRLAKLDADLVVAGNAFQKFLDQIATELGNSSDSTNKVFQLRESQGLMADLRELGKGTVAIYTVIGEDKYRMILTTADFQKGYEYPIKAVDLNSKVLEFRRVLQNPNLDPLPPARELYKILLGPLAKDLEAVKARTLMWSLDGVLRYVPMSALHDGKRYLVEQYQNIVFTPASQARLKDLPGQNWNALGLGVTKAQGERFGALPGVADEMYGIIKDGPNSKGVLPGTIKLDEQFTQEAMLTGLRQRPLVVHVASHFQFSPGNETNSALLLGDGTMLSLGQIKSLPNVFGGVELLTLSACNTATGGGGANGKEVEGFGVLAQRQGAKAVIASLWPVADRSTKELMQDFYRLREAKSNTTKSDALALAQLHLLRGEIKIEGSTSKAPYSHPFYWAPFILIGNWK